MASKVGFLRPRSTHSDGQFLPLDTGSLLPRYIDRRKTAERSLWGSRRDEGVTECRQSPLRMPLVIRARWHSTIEPRSWCWMWLGQCSGKSPSRDNVTSSMLQYSTSG